MSDLLFRAHRAELLAAISAVDDAVASSSDIPILAMILLKVQGDRLVLRATNLEIEIEADCDLLEGADGASTAIPGAQLRDIIKNMPESAEIEFHAHKSFAQIILRSGRASFTLHCLSERDFPSLAGNSKGTPFSVAASILADAIGRTSYAVDRGKSARPMLVGIHMHPLDDGRRLSVVGCDGKCVAAIRIPTESPADFPPVTMPEKTAATIRKHLDKTKSTVELRITDRLLDMRCENVRIISKLIEEQFVDYVRVTPQSNDRRARANVEMLIKTIVRVSAVANTPDQRIALTFEDGALKIETLNTDGQSAVDVMPVEYADDTIRIGFNGSLLRKTLESIPTSDVDIKLGDIGSPGLFLPTIDKDETFVLFAMRV